jgi:hypothetical protein
MIPNPDISAIVNNSTHLSYDYIDKASAIADMVGLAFM